MIRVPSNRTGGETISSVSLQHYFNSIGLGSRVIVQAPGPTSLERMAAALHCEPARITKMIPLLLDDGPILIVTSGDAGLNRAKFKDAFHQKLAAIPADELRELTGYAPGFLCPFDLKKDVRVYLDISIKRFGLVHVADNSFRASIQLAPLELIHYTKASGWIDVCRGWLANGNDIISPICQKDTAYKHAVI